MAQEQANSVGTAMAILDIAERLVQQRGFNGFSYADVSAELGITRASLHYHFAGKAQLGEALISRYATRFAASLTDIDTLAAPPIGKLRSYCEIYRGVLAEHRMCLCGMLAAEFDTLPGAVRQAVINFFDQNQAWLSAFLERSSEAGALRLVGPPDRAARTVIAALEGAMLVSRPYGDTAVLDSVTDRIIEEFSA
ncbi:MAG TPA: TetR/AcrR family transcriptional regulator [Acidimicrobiales bacterium]|nr:TetR/AcrR family transcriptional regulator [Acidimicrobiales bacterium]